LILWVLRLGGIGKRREERREEGVRCVGFELWGLLLDRERERRGICKVRYTV
jgi:hypothetical protein